MPRAMEVERKEEQPYWQLLPSVGTWLQSAHHSCSDFGAHPLAGVAHVASAADQGSTPRQGEGPSEDLSAGSQRAEQLTGQPVDREVSLACGPGRPVQKASVSSVALSLKINSTLDILDRLHDEMMDMIAVGFSTSLAETMSGTMRPSPVSQHDVALIQTLVGCSVSEAEAALREHGDLLAACAAFPY